MKIVRVDWEDITCRTGWSDINREESLLKITSVGFLLKKDKKNLLISPTISLDNESKSDSLVIPLGVVKKITVIGKL